MFRMMPTIARTIRVHFDHRVHFTRGLFAPSNSLLQTLLAQTGRVPKVLAVLDEGLAQARPNLPEAIQTYFSGLGGQLALAGPPLIIEGGERAKKSYFHVSEIHSQ